MASKVDARLLKSTKFPQEFNQKVDMQKVNLQVMKKWIANKISDILGNEDDVVIELCFNLIEGTRYPDIKSLQIQLTGFLDKDTALFCKDLWKLLLSAQGSPQGVPKELLEAKKLELMQEKRDADKAADDARRRRDDFDHRDREVSELKERDRRDRPNNRGDTWQGRRGNHNFDNRNRRVDPPNRGSRDQYGRDRDRYVPSDRQGRGRDEDRRRRRPRSPSPDKSSRSKSRDRSASASSSGPNTPPRRRASPPRQRGSRKRSRSPRGDAYRPRQDRRGDREHRCNSARQSRSVSSDRSSPAPKRRRGSKSRSKSPSRRRRRSPSSASSSRSRSRSRDRSSSVRKQPRRRHSNASDDSDSGRDDRKDRTRPSQREGKETSLRRNSSSASSNSSRRAKPANDLEDGGRPSP